MLLSHNQVCVIPESPRGLYANVWAQSLPVLSCISSILSVLRTCLSPNVKRNLLLRQSGSRSYSKLICWYKFVFFLAFTIFTSPCFVFRKGMALGYDHTILSFCFHTSVSSGVRVHFVCKCTRKIINRDQYKKDKHTSL
ncbi:hypothetical protein CW304_12335 [Bacillus sp. UFRGS-B20]|nr:hypothetical protein CW304_12335 [Bacillus sp. UFRGS-B20]